MNGSTARKVVIVIVLAIAFVELGVSSKFGSIWQLAFQGSLGSEQGQPKPKDTTSATSTGNPSQSATAHQTTSEQNTSLL